MAARNVSPGGALLRASRVFSIPPPLPAPTSSLFGSDSATLAHPIHQSITTPFAALQRGDWGFKRPLPKKSTTKTSTPSIRVKAIDNYNQYTDFVSSADHALTLKKWQELDMPLTIPVAKNNANSNYIVQQPDSRRSVFDDEVDKIADIEDKIASEDLRWNFKGPWLAALNEGDFQEYMRRSVKGRKTEFQEFLRAPCAERLTSIARAAFIPSTDEDTETFPQVYSASDVTEEQLGDFIKSLRHDRKSLNKLVRAFLDLPPAPTKKKGEAEATLDFLKNFAAEKEEEEDLGFLPSNSPYADSGPPKTHPSAGLSYLRTSAFTPNHPIHGPRSSKAPVEARIVVPRNSAVARKNTQPLIGVGGIVCDIPTGSENGGWEIKRNENGNRPTVAGLLNIEPDKVGGSRAYVTPKHATIDPQGRVIMKVDAADPVAVAIKLGKVPEVRRAPTESIGMIGSSRSIFGSRSVSGRDYGLSSRGPFSSRPARKNQSSEGELDYLANITESYLRSTTWLETTLTLSIIGKALGTTTILATTPQPFIVTVPASVGVAVESRPNLNFAALLPNGTTNQQAELHAGLAGLEEAKSLSTSQNRTNAVPELVVIKSDSAYLVKGMTEWVVNWERNGYRDAHGQQVMNQNLFRSLREEVRELEEMGTKVQFWQVPRAQNSEADALANWALNNS